MKYANIIELNGEVILDLTKDTVSANTLALGATAHDSTGQPIVGTAVIGDTDLSSATVALGEDGKVYAFVNGQLVGIGVAIEDLRAPEGGDEPDAPETTGPVSLAAGAYTPGTIQLALDGDASASTRMVKTWDELVNEGYIVVYTGGEASPEEASIQWSDSWDIVVPSGINLRLNNDNGRGRISGVILPYGDGGLSDYEYEMGNIIVIPNTFKWISCGCFNYYYNRTVYFCGTEEEWNAINIDPDNDFSTTTIIYNCYYPNSCDPNMQPPSGEPEEPNAPVYDKTVSLYTYTDDGDAWIDFNYAEGETWRELVARYPDDLSIYGTYININADKYNISLTTMPLGIYKNYTLVRYLSADEQIMPITDGTYSFSEF